MKSNKPYYNYPQRHFCLALLVILTTHKVQSEHPPLVNRCPKKGPAYLCLGWDSFYDPVKCGECEYDNQCFATTASSDFTAETCVKLCPQSPSYGYDNPCSYREDPVVCGIKALSVKCIYENQCFATVASSNFTAETCDKVCPNSSNDNDCSIDVVDPVKCQNNFKGRTYECEYPNQCLATAASDGGFTTANCFNQCPKNLVQARGGCFGWEARYDPVKCGECEYKNQCYATSSYSGFTADTCEKAGCLESYKQDNDCEDVYDPVICEGSECEFNNQCSATAASYLFTEATCKRVLCPESSPDIDCTEEYDPEKAVKCGDSDCLYNNQCLATAASSNFTAETCEKLDCPNNPPDIDCSSYGDDRPVFCGEDLGLQCRYDNQCFASAASSNFKIATCTYVECPVTLGVNYHDRNCWKYDPVICDLRGLECRYNNQCQATAASTQFNKFTSENCRKEVCHDSSNDETCSKDVFDPVKCGDYPACEYQNQCYATAAGFSAASCSKHCPKNHYSWSICEDNYDPVKCGECEYQNQCYATSAFSGFTAKTCKKVLCPESPNDMACPTTYDPVKCGEDHKCEYDNQCLATAASSNFTAETCKKSCKTGNNIFIHDELCEDSVCEDSTSYKFKLDNGNERRCAFISKKHTRKRQEMYCKGETATECCNACKRKKCEDKEDFKFKLKNGKSADCSWFEKGKPKMRGKRKSRYCKGRVKRKCCKSCE